MIVERNISNTLANVRLFPKTKYKALMVAGYYCIIRRTHTDSGMVFVGFNNVCQRVVAMNSKILIVRWGLILHA